MDERRPDDETMMNSQQRSMTIALWALLVLVMAGVIGAGVWSRFRDDGKADSRPAVADDEQAARLRREFWPAPAFSVKNQDDKPVSSADLAGHVYIADFIFTNCAGPCPLMTQRMDQLQKQVTDPSVRFVSFSVDPQNDTPAALTKYAKDRNLDLTRWSFLTGDYDAMQAIAKGMKVAAAPQDNIVIHSTVFMLVDAAGQVRGIYDTQGADADVNFKHLADDAKKLAADLAKTLAGGRP